MNSPLRPDWSPVIGVSNSARWNILAVAWEPRESVQSMLVKFFARKVDQRLPAMQWCVSEKESQSDFAAGRCKPSYKSFCIHTPLQDPSSSFVYVPIRSSYVPIRSSVTRSFFQKIKIHAKHCCAEVVIWRKKKKKYEVRNLMSLLYRNRRMRFKLKQYERSNKQLINPSQTSKAHIAPRGFVLTPLALRLGRVIKHGPQNKAKETVYIFCTLIQWFCAWTRFETEVKGNWEKG